MASKMGIRNRGNYAASLLAHKMAVEQGYDDCIYLDPATHTKIEEVGRRIFLASRMIPAP
ncbi:hypothetical protein HpBGD77_21990 [Helicobacter pylori]